jgi:hypothetical protein
MIGRCTYSGFPIFDRQLASGVARIEDILREISTRKVPLGNQAIDMRMVLQLVASYWKNDNETSGSFCGGIAYHLK